MSSTSCSQWQQRRACPSKNTVSHEQCAHDFTRPYGGGDRKVFDVISLTTSVAPNDHSEDKHAHVCLARVLHLENPERRHGKESIRAFFFAASSDG